MKINLTSPINSLSYGYVGLNLLKSLINVGYEVSLNPIGEMDYSPFYKEYVRKTIISEFKRECPHLILWHHFGLEKFVQKNCHNIGFPIFEINNFSQKEIEQFNLCREIWVTCQWYKEILSKFISIPIKIVNLGVDPEIFKEEIKKENKVVKFLNIGKWEIRKGHDFLPGVFQKAFQTIDDVELVMIPVNPFLHPDEQKSWKSFYTNKLGQKVKILDNRLTNQEEVVKIMNSCDAGIYPSRAEGWLLPLLEMMFLNKPVITTNYSGQTEFCNKNNSYLIEITEEEVAYDGKWFFGQSTWASLGKDQEEQCVEYLRRLYREIKEEKQFDIKQTVKNFIWHNSAQQIINNLM